eukprot:GDKI01014268.1.p2 GENE.GDKI01014268.1~~GDKI01014268.1.p2  ORF type:complete len:143 (-),score=63.39 GDKI01014268.1:851-1279(-)
MAIGILPYPSLFVFAVSVVYPMYCSLQVLLKSGEDSKTTTGHLVQWTFYWVIHTAFTWIESTFLFFLVDFFPLYIEIKLLAYAWLVCPQFFGAAFLWDGIVKKPYSLIDKQLVDFITTNLKAYIDKTVNKDKAAFEQTPKTK